MVNGLKPCPFCGASIIDMIRKRSEYGDYIVCKCTICGVQTKGVTATFFADSNAFWENNEDAITKAETRWNMRNTSDVS